eukprot:CAMPEP_0182419340 /NCGR_PEP_ID=MMETSP1167-20130531/3788_1 /TAXON_ID=2988 /ORGANISM="Mallomonas Sp, Strain CCMP3275" /LENGTH=108 /DNA_ID=CAMNT_0024594185 /DNA_START=669 /DNA_END=992 /DNA_ORIENTATION=+
MCICGGEGVMESGGIVNKLGTYQIALVAKLFSKPFYTAVESYKFARLYPLSQRDVTDLCLCPSSPVSSSVTPPQIDYTPAEYLSLLFTDIGVLTPAAVSEELIRLYHQ